MCQPTSYIHPRCGHLVAAPHIWVLERCNKALRCGFDCWIPTNVLRSDVQRKPWRGGPLAPCEECNKEGEQNAATSTAESDPGIEQRQKKTRDTVGSSREDTNMLSGKDLGSVED